MNKENITVGNIIYNIILEDVICGRLEAKKKLKLNELKNTYNVSVSTLREVLNRLTNDGFIVAEEQRGFFVAPLTKQHFEELIYLRYLLESNMIKLSIKEGDIEWEGEIIAKHHCLRRYEEKLASGEEQETYEFCMADFTFHKAVLSACNYNEFLSLHKIIYRKFLRYQIIALGFPRERAMEEHKEILEHCLNRNVKEVLKVLKTHIYETSNLFVEED